ncbi:MAG TPA: hypothetical protein VEP90_17510 [Methylomirabilota bacterium]|nr:hypothetical protein [Methylomirabilota bacterium]
MPLTTDWLAPTVMNPDKKAPIMSKDLKKMMGIETLPKVKKDLPEADDDFNHARENLLELIKACQSTIDRLMLLSEQSDLARYYEVLNATMKTMVEANRELLALQKQIRSIKESPAEGPKKVVNNLVMTTADLLNMIKDANKGPKTINHDPSDEGRNN